MRQIHVSVNESDQRFDKLLLKYFNRASKSFVYKMLRKKNITLNGKKASGNEILKVGDEIKLFFAEETIENLSCITEYDIDYPLDIVYEDTDVLVLNKPVGILSQKAQKDDISMNEMVIAYLLKSKQITWESLHRFRPAVCNRLDRNTSGIMIAGKSLLGLQEISRLFKERALEKYYLCIVEGRITERKAIQGYLTKKTRNRVAISPSPQDGESFIETEYTPLFAGESYTILEVHLITGKTHQIRAHLASEGHPLIGDYKYGNPSTNKIFKEKYNLKSQLLHSWRLKITGENKLNPQLKDTEFSTSPSQIFQRITEDITNDDMEFQRSQRLYPRRLY